MTGPARVPVEGWVEVDDGTRLFTRTWHAKESAAGLLVIHGLGDHSGRYGELGTAMARAGVTVTAADLRGHGRSPGRRGDMRSLEVVLSDLEALSRRAGAEVRPEAPSFLFGHSMGGLLCLLYAMVGEPSKLEGLLVSAPWLATAAPVPPWKELLGRILLRVAPGWGISTGLRARDLSRDEEWIEAYRSDPLVHRRISSRLYDVVGRAQRVVLDGRLKLPALFLVPGSDPLVDGRVSRAMAEREGADLKMFPEFRHEGFGEIGRESFFRTAVEWILGRAWQGSNQNPEVA